jgi:hypothetical protein
MKKGTHQGSLEKKCPPLRGGHFFDPSELIQKGPMLHVALSPFPGSVGLREAARYTDEIQQSK